MTQKEYASTLASSTGLDVDTIGKIISAMPEVMAELALSEASVAIPRFGTFYPVKRDEYVSTDEESGLKMLYPPTIRLEFRPSVVLRKRIK